MNDPLDNCPVHRKSMEFYDQMWVDTEVLLRDLRGREIAHQLVRSAGSICANIEKGYSRGSKKEFLYFLRVSRGSARETKGWYVRSKIIYKPELIQRRLNEIDELIALLVSMINTMTNKKD